MKKYSFAFFCKFLCLLIEIFVNNLNIEHNNNKINNKIINNKKNKNSTSHHNKNKIATNEINKLLQNSILNKTKKSNINQNKTPSDFTSIIKTAYSDDGENEEIYSANNPITGMDYWKSKKIKSGNYADWKIELINNTLIKQFFLEFDFPPTDIVIFSKTDNTNWLPMIHKDLSNDFKNFVPNKSGRSNYLIKSFLIETNSTNPMKHLKFRFINRLENEFNILLSRFKLIEDKRESSFVIRKLVIENGKFQHLCMKYNNIQKSNNLVLENCYYCILFNLDLCTFNYKQTDKFGHVFSYKNKEIKIPFEFYIKNIYDISNSNEVKKLSYSKSIKSFANDIVDYSSELDYVNANSTLSTEYGVRNILYDNLDYWSSELFFKPKCQEIILDMQLKNEIIVKRIIIEWIKPPAFFKLEFCDIKNTCISKSYGSHDIIQFRSYLTDVYQKLYKLRIILSPDLEGVHSNFCIFSIKHISIFKNEILLDPLLTSELYGEEVNPLLFYSDNFIVTRIDNLKLGIDLQQSLSENIYKSDAIPEKIIEMFSDLKQQLRDNSRNSLNWLVYQSETSYRDYMNKNEKSISLIKSLFKHLEKYGASAFSSHLADFRNETLGAVKKFKSDLDYLEKSISRKMLIKKQQHKQQQQQQINDISNNIKLQSLNFNVNYNYSSLEKLVEANNKLIEQESAFFEETNSDKYRYKLNSKIRFLKYLEHVYEKIDFYSGLKATFKRHSKILSELESYNAKWTQRMYELIDDYYNKFISSKQNELNSVMRKLEISLQNVKLIRKIDTQLFIKIYNKNINPITFTDIGVECKEISIIKNSYYDNFFAKLLVNFNQTNFQSENIIVVKFINRRFFYYVKISFSKIELWNKDLENHHLIGEYSVLTEADKFNAVKDFSKLVFVLVKVNKGILDLAVKIDYNPIPGEIKEHMEFIKTIHYDKLIKIFLDDPNKFQNYYKNSTVLYEGRDTNLFLNGYFGYSSPAKNLHFLLIARMPTELAKNREFTLSSLNSKYKFNYFPDYENLSPKKLDLRYKKLFNLDDSWKFYYTNFKILNNFYFKFEVNMGKLFSNNFFFQIDSDRTDYFLQNQIIKLSNSFILKVFFVSKISNSITKIYRTTISFDKQSENFAFIYEKNLSALRIKIKSRKNTYKKLLSISDFSFASFGFYMNDSNKLALSSIYFTDTYNLNDSDANDARIFNKCSKRNFQLFPCPSKDAGFCQMLYCKICCKRTSSFEVSLDKCQASCVNAIRYNLV